jgi:WD repeat-containing protein mio
MAMMEAAIRWSPHSTPDHARFMIVSVSNDRLRLCEIEGFEGKKVRSKQLASREKLGNYTAFDWSKVHEHIVAIGARSGEAILVHIDADKPSDTLVKFPVKHQRLCNSIAFSTKNYLATGLDRVRNDFCMNIYDINATTYGSQPQEPYRKLSSSEAITSIKFFSKEPDTLIAGVHRQCIRLYDLRGDAQLYAYIYVEPTNSP